MPFAFPSHQGLIAPLWRRWPGFFDVPAMFIGAAMPDVVDGVIGAMRGHFGQGVGHSLIALPLLCIPGGLLLWIFALLASRPLGMSQGRGFFGRIWNAGVKALHESPGEGGGLLRAVRVIFSMGVGVFSHLVFDLISHGGFVWLYPWMPKTKIFPAWWYITWTEVSLPGYKEHYPIGPHFLVWIILGVLGIILLFYPYIRQRKQG